MTKKIVTATELVLYVISLVLLYLDGMYSWICVDQIPPHARSVSTHSFIWATIDQNWADFRSFPYGSIVIILIVVNIAFLLLYLFKKQVFQDRKICVTLSAASTLSYVLVCVYLDNFANKHFTYQGIRKAAWIDFEALFYIELAILFITLVLNCYKYFGKLPYENKNIKKEESLSIKSSAEEITKYKELLDQGVITQEEFDAKKKQLLGL